MAAKPEDLNLDYNCSIKINGSEYLANTDETILDVSKRNGIEIPHLCFKEGMRPDGNCRVCVVEIEGERALQPSCIRKVTDGMIINTENSRVIHSQKVVIELLQSDVSSEQYDCLLYTSPSPRDLSTSRMPSSA